MKRIILTATILSLGLAAQASANTKAEKTGVLGGAVAGALAGGPVGLVIGAALGGHYGVVVDRKNAQAERADELDVNLQAAREQVDATRGQVSALSGELARSRTQVSQLSAEMDELLRDQALLADLKFDVLFRTNATSLGDADRAQIALLAKFMKRHPELRVRLNGHTDIRGGESHNETLSRQRVEEVAGLLETMDIDASRIVQQAHGERAARAGEGDLDGYALDRRVSVQFDVVNEKSPTVAHSD